MKFEQQNFHGEKRIMFFFQLYILTVAAFASLLNLENILSDNIVNYFVFNLFTVFYQHSEYDTLIVKRYK